MTLRTIRKKRGIFTEFQNSPRSSSISSNALSRCAPPCPSEEKWSEPEAVRCPDSLAVPRQDAILFTHKRFIQCRFPPCVKRGPKTHPINPIKSMDGPADLAV